MHNFTQPVSRLKFLEYPPDAEVRMFDKDYIAPSREEACVWFSSNGGMLDKVCAIWIKSSEPAAFRTVTKDSWEEWKSLRDHRPEAIAEFLCKLLSSKPHYLKPEVLAYYIDNGVSELDKYVPFYFEPKESANA